MKTIGQPWQLWTQSALKRGKHHDVYLSEALEMYQKTLTDKILADDTGMVKDNVDLSKFQEEIVSAAASVEHSTAASRHKIEREEPAVITRLRSQLGETSGDERKEEMVSPESRKHGGKSQGIL